MIKDDELVQDFSFEDLLKAYYDCRKRKRNTISALKFELQLEKNLLELYHDLKSGHYKIGRYICFVVLSPKPREVWAANFRDRIVHHLVYNAIKERFHKRFINDTYSCIPKRGTLACAKKVLHYARSASHNYKRPVYFLKADISNFFVSINKKILFKLVCRYVKEDWLLKLLKIIIFHNPKNNVLIKSSPKTFEQLPSHKSLWNTPVINGLPIGNLTSQFFSNIYLNVLDSYVKHNLNCKYYCRYVDDFIILAESTIFLMKCFKNIRGYIKNELNLVLNINKCFINKVEKGIDVVGYFIKPHRMFLRTRTLNKIKFTVNNWKKSRYKYEKYMLSKFHQTINSYLGMLRHTPSFNFRFYLCSEFNSLFIFTDYSYQKSLILHLF